MTALTAALEHYRHGRFAEARAAADRILAANTSHADAHNLAGACARALGDVAGAEHHWRAALVHAPAQPEIHSNLGVLLHDSDRLAEAEASFRVALTINPRNAAAHFNLGRVLADLGRSAEAEAEFRRAVELEPRYADAWTGLGVLLMGLGRTAEAEHPLAKAAALVPDQPDAHYNLGTAFWTLGRLDDAVSSLSKTLDLNPNHLGALFNLATAARTSGRFGDAEALLRRARELAPGLAPVHWSLGAVFHEQGRLTEAEAASRAALALDAHDVQAMVNLGVALRDLGRLDEAETALRKAAAYDPGHSAARFNLGLLLLSTGRFAEGWTCYAARSEARFGERAYVPPDLPFPPWSGESLAGKSILILREQGIGDEIQCARFIPILRAMGATRITLMTRTPLLGLFSQLGADRLIVEGDVALDPHDYWVFSFGIAGVICRSETLIPATLPYLKADPAAVARWRPRFDQRRLKVGLVWRGGTLHKNDRFRSLPGLDALAPLGAVMGITFYGLQKGEDEKVTAPAGFSFFNLSPEIGDFSDTAAIVDQLDLVITVDTAVAHLAGALGKPVWVMVPAINTDWRWLVGRDDSPWYPGVMRVFRQRAPGDWPSTIAALAAELVSWVASHRHDS